ncbi:MAG: glycosyltransferase family 4 protein [Defluviicoccus sp.]|nr:MAG: glycosyltransferase family 4 protein [Defluviicoccus sp.]
MSAPVAFILKGYPRLSETFIAQEIRALEQRGLDIRLYSMRLPTDPHVHPVHREITAPVTYLPEYLHHQPLRVWRSWRAARRLPGYSAARAAWLRDLRRDFTRNRARRFGQALVLAAELPTEIEHLHAHFLHTPASVVRYAARMRQLPWTVSAHAKDIWTTPEWEKREKLADCRWLVTCTGVGARHLSDLAEDPERVALIYHGLDPRRFPAPPRRPRPARDGSDPEDPVILLSVGRAVAKKGFPDLLDALARLPRDLAWRLIHIGGGPLLDALRQQAAANGLDERINWRGAQPQDVVLQAYREADLFVLACRIAEDGDRDGLPNVLMEAQSQGICCLSTDVSAISELIEDGESGLLVAPDAPDVLARTLHRLIRYPDYRARLGYAGAERVRQAFAFERGIDRLAARFGTLAPSSVPVPPLLRAEGEAIHCPKTRKTAGTGSPRPVPGLAMTGETIEKAPEPEAV